MAIESLAPQSRRLFRRRPSAVKRPQSAVPTGSDKVPLAKDKEAERSSRVLTSLLDTFISYGEVVRALRFLKEAVEGSIYGSISGQHIGPTSAEDQMYVSWVQSLDLTSLTKDSYHPFIKQITEEVTSMPKLVVYLPFVPRREDILNIYFKAKESINKPFIADIRFDKDLIAGCALVWGGRYQDFSLRNRLRENKEGIQKLLSSYTANQ